MTSGDDKAEIGDPPASRRYAVAVACMAVAFAVRYFLTPLLGEELPFMMFIAAALVAAWYGGAAAGILALLIGLFLADWFFLSRVRAGLSSSTAALYLVRYIFTASVGVGLIEAMHRNRRRLQEEVAWRDSSACASRKSASERRGIGAAGRGTDGQVDAYRGIAPKPALPYRAQLSRPSARRRWLHQLAPLGARRQAR